MGAFGALGYFVYNGNQRVEELLEQKKAELRAVRGLTQGSQKEAAEDDE
jgi:hypothetical protein